jgi:hypothetical protein
VCPRVGGSAWAERSERSGGNRVGALGEPYRRVGGPALDEKSIDRCAGSHFHRSVSCFPDRRYSDPPIRRYGSPPLARRHAHTPTVAAEPSRRIGARAGRGESCRRTGETVSAFGRIGAPVTVFKKISLLQRLSTSGRPYADTPRRPYADTLLPKGTSRRWTLMLL